MPRLKRTRDEAELDIQLAPDVPPEHEDTLLKLRNMWEFASFMQYLYLFGQAVKVDNDFDMEDLEMECLRPSPSEKLAQIGLQLLKYVSSHRGLTPDIFDEYTRRQYMAKAPHHNPFGEEEEPNKFNDFDVFTRIRILHQLSIWTLGNADRMRSLMPEGEDELMWRMEPLGWDKDDRAYYLLDDNRLYRRTDEPPPPPLPKTKAQPKAKTKAKAKAKATSKAVEESRSRATRSSKRQKMEEPDEEINEVDVDSTMHEADAVNGVDDEEEEESDEPGFGFTSKTWECVAITLDDYQEFLSTIFRTRDPNEKELRKRIEEDVLPIIEKRAEAYRQKQLKKIRELENLQKMATAKRSSRLADKADREKQEREEREAEEKRQRELKMALEEQEKQRKIEEGHESRRVTREQRLRDREAKRILHEEELARIEEQAIRGSSQDTTDDPTSESSKRISERQLKTQREQHQKELDRLAEEDENWFFDCSVCGIHGENLDDGTHSVACEKCNVWQHSKCHGFSPKQAESDGFHFVCSTCKRKEREAKMPKIAPLKLKNPSASPTQPRTTSTNPSSAERPRSSGLPDHIQRQLDMVEVEVHVPARPPPGFSDFAGNGARRPSHDLNEGREASQYPPVGNFGPPLSQLPYQGNGNNSTPLEARASQLHASSSPPQMATMQGSPHQHQEQHRNVHQQAVAAAGGHPAYQPQQYHPTTNGYSPRASYGQPLMQHPPPHPQALQRVPPPIPPQPHQQPHHRTLPPPHETHPHHQSSGMNGMHSPTKPREYPQIISPAPATQSSPQKQPSPHLAHSPRPVLPPPFNTYAQHAPQAMPNSSPPSRPAYSQSFQWTTPQGPTVLPTTQQMRPPSANGEHRSMHHSPHTNPSPAGANASNVAADGMSGPWPQGSKVIPQKHDQSPAPPSSSHGLSDTKVIPPIAPLMPSPDQRQLPTGPQSIPVKKNLEANRTSFESSPPQGGGIASSPVPQLVPTPKLAAPVSQMANGVLPALHPATPTPKAEPPQ